MKVHKEKSLETLRKIILEKDEKKLEVLDKELRILKAQMADKESLIASLDPVIADLLERKIINSRDEMAEALAPIIGEAIKRQVSEAKDDVVDALYPVIGKTIRKSVAEAMKKLVETVNQKIDQTLRGRLFAKRVQSKITGVSKGELVLKDALPFRIEEIFLIHKSSGLLLSYISAIKAEASVDQELVSGMLTAIKDFVGEAFKTETEQELNEILYGDSKILLEMGRYSYLAVVISGVEPADFQDNLHKLSRRIHNRFFKLLRQFDGDMTKSGEIAKPMRKFLKTYNVEKEATTSQKSKSYLPRLLSIMLIIVLLIFTALKGPDYLASRKIQKTVNAKIDAIPGLEQQEIDYKTSKRWVTVSGSVNSFKLKDDIDSLIHSIQGIRGVYNRLVVVIPEKEILQQIEQRISQSELLRYLAPRFIIEADQVIIEGMVPNFEIRRELGYLVSEIAGVRVVINNLQLLKKKQISTEKVRAFLSEHTIYFDVNSITISDAQIDKINAILEFVKELDDLKLVLRGYSDNSSTSDYNLKLSEQRAQDAADYLVYRDIPLNNIIIESYGEKNPIASNETETGRAKNRRVEFDIIKVR